VSTDLKERRWYSNLELGFYFASRYRPANIENVVTAVLPWLGQVPLSVQYENIPASKITHEEISDRFIGSTPPVSMRPDSADFHRLLKTKYVPYIRSSLHVDNRPLTMWNFVSADDTLTVKVMIALRGNESKKPISKVIHVMGGETPLLRALDQVDAFWTTIGVETYTPVLGELEDGVSGLPDSGCYGSELVGVIGGNELRDRLRGCPKKEFLPRGGVFLCWPWYSANVRETEDYHSFRASEVEWRPRVLRSLRWQGDDA
jgi:hypothetical protein